MQRLCCVLLGLALIWSAPVASACDGLSSSAVGFGTSAYVIAPQAVFSSSGFVASGAYVVPQAAVVPLAVPFAQFAPPVYSAATVPVAVAAVAEPCADVRVFRQRVVRRPVRVRQRFVQRSVIR